MCYHKSERYRHYTQFHCVYYTSTSIRHNNKNDGDMLSTHTGFFFFLSWFGCISSARENVLYLEYIIFVPGKRDVYKLDASLRFQKSFQAIFGFMFTCFINFQGFSVCVQDYCFNYDKMKLRTTICVLVFLFFESYVRISLYIIHVLHLYYHISYDC